MATTKDHAANTRHGLLLSKIQHMSEADFTVLVLIPLFKSMGFSVDYNGGPNEGGKDLICRRGGDFGLGEIGVIQVKKTTPSAAAGKSNSFAGIVTQLQQASEKKVPSLSGHDQLPNYVYFITPYEINTRALETRFEAFRDLQARGVRILDGRKVIDTLLEKLPTLAEELCGKAFSIKDRLLSNLSNSDLLSALNYSGEKKISEFYCDLDFGVGKLTSKYLFSLEFSAKLLYKSVPSIKWKNLERLYHRFKGLSGVNIFESEVDQIRAEFSRKDDAWKSETNQKIVSELVALVVEVEEIFDVFVELGAQVLSDALTNKIDLTGNELRSENIAGGELTAIECERLRAIQGFCTKLEGLYAGWRSCPELTAAVHDNMCETLDAANIFVGQLRVEIGVLRHGAEVTVNRLLKDVSRLTSIFREIEKLVLSRVSEPNYEFIIAGPSIAREIQNQRDWITNGIYRIGNDNPTPGEIKAFFLRCQELFEVIDEIFDDKYLAESLGRVSCKQIVDEDSKQRISMPMREVFATGINCAVYGEAGAGKSTTLYQYAALASANDREDELTLFLPLTRILGNRNGEMAGDFLSPLQRLEDGIAGFLRVGNTASDKELLSFIKSKKKVTFVFDGVDEIIKSAPWVIDAISEIETVYINSQIILSSRASGAYVEKIKYLSLTLLPFTDEQVVEFINGWFADQPSVAETVTHHLAQTSSLQEIVRNPLLTTILCVLAANQVPLPNSELSMYAERLNLLFGHYDIHKKTKRLSSHHILLEAVARKLAFFLHSKNSRAATLGELERAAVASFSKLAVKATNAEIQKAVQELVDPCNVLVPMTADGDFGFGHLRYQEHLCALELRCNRGIDVGALLIFPWWRAVLVLFSLMTDDITYVISDILEKGHNITKRKPNLLAMIATRGKVEQRMLNNLIESHVKLDWVDRELQEYDDFENDTWSSSL